MKKKILIDSEKCIGCSLCANTCQQSAIEMVDGKAKVVREDVCDGIGRCLPVCPVNAITFVEDKLPCGCPGSKSKMINKEQKNDTTSISVSSQLNQWPVQIKLVPPTAPYFKNADILIAADCTAFSYGNFHNDFIKDKITLIGCPKLDEGDYADKLDDIFENNDINSITVVRMEVPCCSGIVSATKTAVVRSGKEIPVKVVIISLNGEVLEM